MLAAYFDDSGTHDTSDIVLVAGILGTEWQLTSLDRLWKKHLDNPLDGQKAKLRRFHMVDCYESRNEFAGWSRTETDYFCHQLQTAIIDSGVSAYGVAVSRKDWDRIVTDDIRGFLGDAEGYAITQCYVRTIKWAQDSTFDPKITFVFDNRPSEIQRRARAVEDAFEKHVTNPKIYGCEFRSSYEVRQLQAADLFAWEFYQHAKEIFAARANQPSKRHVLERLQDGMPFLVTQFASASSIQQIADYIREQPGDLVKAAGDHFTYFDPSNPDYSHLLRKTQSA